MDVFDAVRARMEELHVPGVAVGVLEDGEERHEGFGVTSVDNPLEVTPDTRFQIGSISKTFTGTAVMKLVAAGSIDLDRPVREYVPELELADADAAGRVTMRHLLAHTGGWVGDYFDDTGWGDDAVARFVGLMRTLPQLTPLGELWSYNNSGFALAGRVVEVVTGEPFEDVVKRLVFDPLELTSSTYWPWEVMTERFAVGHADEDGAAVVARPWPVGRSAHPAGGIASTTRDLLRYARLHLDPPPELAPMQEPQAAAEEEGEWVGLTWYGEDTFGTIRHGGGTMGQLSMLVLRPETGFALAVLTNHSPNGLQVIHAALKAAGLKGPEPPGRRCSSRRVLRRLRERDGPHRDHSRGHRDPDRDHALRRLPDP
ncbi:MAG TPA: serine hydrolase domain-containing protein [Gaiellaceae bacterium]|nr:serine hydrolase domain-containing protein [Gaiellaceae bacterium]